MEKLNLRTTNDYNASGSTSNIGNREREVEVLYQQMGNQWYAFALVDGEVFMGQISDAAIHCDHSEMNAAHMPAA